MSPETDSELPAPARPAQLELDRQPLIAVYGFCIHLLVGSIIFSLLALAASCVHFLVDWIGTFQNSRLIAKTLLVVEYCTFLSDSALYLLFVARTFYRFAKELVKGP